MRKLLALVCALAVAAALLSTSPASAADGGDGGGTAGLERQPWRYVTAEMDADEFAQLRQSGYDVVDSASAGGGRVAVDLVVNGMQLAELERAGADVDVHTDAPPVAAASLQAQTTSGFNVWRTWGGPGGMKEEMEQLAEEYADIVDLGPFGQSVNGDDLLVMRVTGADHPAGRGLPADKPSVMYISLQHAREWVVGEFNRRLLRYYLENYGTDDTVTELVDNTQLWFVLVANPDGYDYTFTEGNRLWRKNLADNDGDGIITAFDGVDPNRNFGFKWGLNNEGSSDDPTSNVYRGPSPQSEPETVAMDRLVSVVKPQFFMNYHSAADLLLYGNGWQVSTPEPDDNLHIALLGTDDNSSVPGYDPDQGAELYITNGNTTDHLGELYGVNAYTPELDTCESAEDIFPDDAFGDDYCESEGRSVFEFPDDEALVQAVFDKNLPLALAVAASAADPDDPVSPTGLVAPEFNVDAFDVSYGRNQKVAVEMKRSTTNRRAHYQVNGGAEQTQPLREWRGGERYGDTGTTYYAEYRATIRNGAVGDEVTVWFSGTNDDGESVTSESFTYTVGNVQRADVLVVANEDYLGFNPEQPGVTSPVYADVIAQAVRDGGRSAMTWDVTAQGVPHDLGVLGHFDAVVWELGDNRLTQEADDVITDTPFGPLPDLQVAERQQFLTLAMRDYLNEGGKLVQTGEYTAYFGFFGAALGGAYYGVNGDPTGDCVIVESFFDDCLIYSDDFAQYYQGVFIRSDFGAPDAAIGDGQAVIGRYAINGAEVPGSGSFQVTSDVLPVEQFPDFESGSLMTYDFDGPPPFGPFSGDYYMGALHSDAAWMRLSQTIDLTAATAADLAFKMSAVTETGYDHVIIEARTAGGDDWTTLPAPGVTSTQTPTECEAGFFADLHPSLLDYFTIDAAGCLPTGATGEWNSFTGDTGGWIDVGVDLSAYAGSTVEVAISYVTDPAAEGIGVFVDDTVVTIDGTSTTTDFEADQGAWTVPGPPADSPGNGADWIRSTELLPPPSAAVATYDTVTFGFGLEAVATDEERARLLDESLDLILAFPRR